MYNRKIISWAKKKAEGSAEIDFCLSFQGRNLGIEVKSAATGRLKSLFSFGHNVKNNGLVRIYGDEFIRKKVEFSGRNFWLTSVPFYLIPRMLEKDFIFPDKYY